MSEYQVCDNRRMSERSLRQHFQRGHLPPLKPGGYDSSLGSMHLTPVSDQEMYVTNVLVPERQRGQGRGTQLMQEIVDRAAAHGASLTLHVSPENQRAVRVYEKVGFQVEEPTGDYAKVPMSENMLFMRRKP